MSQKLIIMVGKSEVDSETEVGNQAHILAIVIKKAALPGGIW